MRFRGYRVVRWRWVGVWFLGSWLLLVGSVVLAAGLGVFAAVLALQQPSERVIEAESIVAMAERINRPAGVTRVKVENFGEVVREEGQMGLELDVAATVRERMRYMLGLADTFEAVVIEIEPRVEYERNYAANNDAGLLAVMENYVGGIGGDFGVQLFELEGKYRAVGLNQDKVFTAASTYKLFVAYSTFVAVESGLWSWEDRSYGENSLSECFDKMITLSDNDCAETIMRKRKVANINNDIWALGISGQSGYHNGWWATAFDLAKLVGMLEVGELPVRAEHREKLLMAMEENVWRSGICDGLEGMRVANKTGALWGLLHDAAVVYSPKGDYVLVIMSDGAGSWGALAGFSAAVEAGR